MDDGAVKGRKSELVVKIWKLNSPCKAFLWEMEDENEEKGGHFEVTYIKLTTSRKAPN
jgi:hypothetical protein